MISAHLIAETNVDPIFLSSHAAKTCYTAEVPRMGETIDVEHRLFRTGHHTTLEHNYFTFNLEGLSISSVVFGLHLNAPFYNTDQRSGRFSKMYHSPDLAGIRSHLAALYPQEDITAAITFIAQGIDLYHKHILSLTQLAQEAIRQERPLASDKYIMQNAPKFAQEQLRMFLSQVMPTALDYTIDTSALCALWRAAWSPELRQVTDMMRDAVLEHHPELAYMFEASARQNRDWAPTMRFDAPRIQDQPTCRLLSYEAAESTAPEAKDSVDILPFSPFAMADNIAYLQTQVEISCATMGQDQRHRTIKRSAPMMTGAFYLPPLLKKAGLAETAQAYMTTYTRLAQRLSPALMTTIAPYGVMVQYTKRADINALKHEQGKRLCLCAQEEIYEISRQLRAQVEKAGLPLAEMLAPPCYQTHKCAEGPRFCGRHLLPQKPTDSYFERRLV